MNNSDITRLVDAASRLFFERCGQHPTAAAVAPGRVEVLGNHTDYNGGFTLSAALEKRTAVVGGANESGIIQAAVLSGAAQAGTPVCSIARHSAEDWANYPFGVIDQIAKLPDAPELRGMTLGILGEVPIGAGLSSSAALEVATALCVQALAPFACAKMEMAKLCQRAENEFVGVQSGLMDQFSSVFGEIGSLLFLDCRTLEHAALRSPAAFEMVICDSMVKHALTGGEYNTRRAECESAARILGARQLRDLSPPDVERGKQRLNENEYKRALHVTSENERVLAAKHAIGEGDLTTLGRLMNESHESSRTLFENTTAQLDRLTEIARSLPGCYGARMTGGGFGGAAICLVEPAKAQEFAAGLAARYGEEIGAEPKVLISGVGEGAMQVDLAPRKAQP